MSSRPPMRPPGASSHRMEQTQSAGGGDKVPTTLPSADGLSADALSRDALKIVGLRKSFRSGSGELNLFQDLSLNVVHGEMVALVGESGSGKSTLLYMASGLDQPSAGEVICAGQRLSSLTEDGASDFRNRRIGFVWQFHHLLPEFTAIENIAMPLLARGIKHRPAENEAAIWLKEVGLETRGSHRSGELSGGEQQRVALARALVTRPQLLLADEPTGNLDAHNAGAVFSLIARLHDDFGLTSLIATHNLDFARQCHRVLRLKDGGVEEVEPNTLD